MDKFPTLGKSKFSAVQPNLFDRLIGVVNPKAALNRIRSRLVMSFWGSTGFITPSKSKRSMRSWFVSGGSADKDTIADLPASRSGSRDLYMNTPVATAALRRMKNNVVGPGLTMQSRINRKILGLDDQAADDWEHKTEFEFGIWANSKNCDLNRTLNFNQIQQHVYFNYLLSGDVLVLLPFRGIKGAPYKLRLHVIEGDRLSNPGNENDTLSYKIRGGVEVDSNGTPVAYHIRKQHPGDYTPSNEWVRVLARGSRSGRPNVLHIFDKDRPGQRRGMPFLAPVLEQLKQLTRFSEAELMAALVSAFFTVFVKTKSGDSLSEGFLPNNDVTTGAADEENLYQMGSGNIIELAEDEEIDIADPKRPNDSFDPFFVAIVKQVGASLGIPFEQLMQHFSSSYSASRAAIIEGYKTAITKRVNFISDFNDPVYESWLTEAVITGRIKAPGFLTNPLLRAAWMGSRWTGPGMGQIDPVKETKASLLKIQGRLSSYEDESQKMGTKDWESAMNRLSKESKLLTEQGIEPSVIVK